MEGDAVMDELDALIRELDAGMDAGMEQLSRELDADMERISGAVLPFPDDEGPPHAG